MKYYMKVTCAFKRARKLPRKTETYESANCVPCNTRKCTHNGFVSDLLKWVLKCRFYRSQWHIPTMTKVSARAYVYRGWYSKRIQQNPDNSNSDNSSSIKNSLKFSPITRIRVLLTTLGCHPICSSCGKGSENTKINTGHY